MRSLGGPVVVVALLLVPTVLACSNILVTKGASADGKTHISYNADEASLIGGVSRWPARENPEGAMRKVYNWDLGTYMGSIPEPERTLNVMGNANEAGVVIGETTHGGLEVLSNYGKTDGPIIDYGSLIWLTLQRATSARQAIDVMIELCETHGYASALEGFSIADADEVWYMELTGRGDYDPKGILFVALRIPDGYVAAHANQARITQFLPCDDPSQCRASPDMVKFATEIGIYDGDGEFSFSDVVDPLTFSGARFCEARVWSIFSQISDDFDSAGFEDYARGYNLTRRMPLWVKPTHKIDRQMIHKLMGSHYEGSFLDPTVDVGSGPEHSPYRWNGLEWQFHNQSYVNERPVGTQATSWHFVATIDGSKPPPMRAVLWFGVDDHSLSPKIPIHGGASRVDVSYDDSDCAGRFDCRQQRGLPGSITQLSLENAWWLSNLVADAVYTRYDRALPVVLAAKAALDAELSTDLATTEHEALALFAQGYDADALHLLGDHAVNVGKKASRRWLGLWQELMVSFIDGKVTSVDKEEKVCGCSKKNAPLTDAFLSKVVEDTDKKYLAASDSRVDADGHHSSWHQTTMLPQTKSLASEFKAIPKSKVRGVF